jgi:uncharacterized protein (TIGR00369 family)
MAKPAEESLEWGAEVLASQPFSVLIGAKLGAFSAGRAEICVPITDRLKQQHGFVHGGVVSYAADNALAYAGGSVLGSTVVTSEFKINYIRPASGERLVARAAVVHAGKSLATCRCDVVTISGGREKLCAIAQGTIARLGEPRKP